MSANTHDRKESRRRFRILFRYLSGAFLVALVVFVAAGCTCKKYLTGKDGPTEDGPTIEIKPMYVLAFAEYGTNLIKVRYSEDGLTWEDGDFPTHQTTLGVGATNAASGVLTMILWTDAAHRVRVHWGLGAAVWDTGPIGASSPTETALSAPVAAYARLNTGENIYLVAFRTTGDKVTLQALATETDIWHSISLGTVGIWNNDVYGRPGIAVLGDKIALGWFRGGSLVLVLGNIMTTEVEGDNVPMIFWMDPYTFTFDETEAGYGGYRYESGFALTQDGSKFYLGVIRRSLGGPLQHENYFIYESDDGISWARSAEMVGIPLYSSVGLAARSDGSLLAAVIGPKEPSHRVIKKYAGGSWTEVVNSSSSSADDVFGHVPAEYRDFALMTSEP